MTTRRERLEAKIEKRHEWAQSRETDSARHFDAAHRIADAIPFGQPILVGHHSEAHARRDAERIHANMAKACESADMAKHHESKAANLAHALDRSIFSDDHDAIAQLEARITEREAYCARVVALNKALRREHKAGMPDGWIERIGATEAEARAILHNVQYDYRQLPMFPAYVTSNARNLIRADRERIKAIQARQARAEAAENAGGVAIDTIGDYARVTFAEKPDRDVLNALRGAGYWWKGGCWTGRADALPECVRELAAAEG